MLSQSTAACLRAVLHAALEGRDVDFEHVPSMGCSIKWKHMAHVSSFEIRDFRGEPFSSAKLSDADTLVVFYRGGWCPYCNFQIRELSQSHEKFEAWGVSLVAISVVLQRGIS
jgi:thiol-disulfide isomerase/thioredoxin